MNPKNIWSLILLITAFFSTGLLKAQNPYQWYDDSYVHSHVSLSLPPSDIDFIIKQITEVKLDAVQFHTHRLDTWDTINKGNLTEKYNFKTVATINHAGVWYPHYYDSDKYVMRINFDGSFAGRWDRKHLCFNAPVVYNEIIPEKYGALARKLKPSQVWIDESIITVNICYCKNCTALYEKKYNTAPPKELTDDNWEQWEQWVKFHRDSYDNWMIKVGESIHHVDPSILVTFNHAYFVEQPEAPPSFIKNLSGDIHNDPLELGLYARYGGSGDLPFDLMTGAGRDTWAGVKPKNMDQIYNDISLIIAHGGKWNIGEFPTDFLTLRKEKRYQGDGFRPADQYLQLAIKGAEFARERQAYCQNTKSIPYAAMLHSAKTHYFHVIINTNTVNEKDDMGKTSDGTLSRNTLGKINSRVFWPNNKPIVDDLVGAYESLIENHIQFDIINKDQLQENLQNYTLLILTEQSHLEIDTLTKIKDFVTNGGNVIASGSTVMAGLNNIFGINVNSLKPHNNAKIKLNDEVVALEKAWDIQPTTSKVLHNTTISNKPFVVMNSFGKGQSIYIGGNIFKDYFNRSGYSHSPKGNEYNTRTFIDSLLNKIQPEPNIEILADPRFELTLRENDEYVYVHIINRTINWKQKISKNLIDITISMPLDSRPKNVALQPGNEIFNYEYNDKVLNLILNPIDIEYYKIIQIRKGI